MLSAETSETFGTGAKTTHAVFSLLLNVNNEMLLTVEPKLWALAS